MVSEAHHMHAAPVEIFCTSRIREDRQLRSMRLAIHFDEEAGMEAREIGVVRAKLWMFIRASSEVLWVFGDFQNTPRSADGQLLFGDDVLGDHS